jgi:hypothetical protein
MGPKKGPHGSRKLFSLFRRGQFGNSGVWLKRVYSNCTHEALEVWRRGGSEGKFVTSCALPDTPQRWYFPVAERDVR